MRNPLGQRLPRKFKINFSGCSTDCGQAMFNDVGVIATTRTLDDGNGVRLPGVHRRRPRAPTRTRRWRWRSSPSREDLLPTIEAVLRVFDQTGNRDNKLRARMKWVVDQLGIDEVRRRVLKVRHTLPASSSWPGGIPEIVHKVGDAPAGRVQHGRGHRRSVRACRCRCTPRDPYGRWVATERHPRQGQRHGVGRRLRRARRHHLGAVPVAGLDPARARRRRAAVATARTSCSAASPRPSCRCCSQRLEAIGMARPGAELARDVVACPGADTCNIAVTQSRGLAKAIGERLEDEGLAEVGGVRINISGCTNSCGQHHTADIGFFGAERRAHGKSAPGYQMLLGGYVGQEQIHFGDKALRLPAKAAPEAAARVIRRFADERTAGETFRAWMDRVGGATAVADGLRDLDVFPSPDRSARVLRRLRRDRAVRGRGRRVGVRGLSARYDAAVAAIDAANAADPNVVDVRGQQVALASPTAGWRSSGSIDWSPTPTSRCSSPPGPITCAAGSCAATPTRGPGRLPAVAQGSEATPCRRRRRAAAPLGYDADRDRAGAGADPSRPARADRARRRSRTPPAWCSSRPSSARSRQRLDHDHLLDVIRKTARKMSSRGLELVASIPLGDSERAVLREALDG